ERLLMLLQRFVQRACCFSKCGSDDLSTILDHLFMFAQYIGEGIIVNVQHSAQATCPFLNSLYMIAKCSVQSLAASTYCFVQYLCALVQGTGQSVLIISDDCR